MVRNAFELCGDIIVGAGRLLAPLSDLIARFALGVLLTVVALLIVVGSAFAVGGPAAVFIALFGGFGVAAGVAVRLGDPHG
ncbi:hypothetical protein ALI144C_45000 [Actinosynnema sp. ALI-1.44]|nr:hypothetical protein ALI144C_45000 [Actinosynnema sp. ALI-1.44]